MLEILRTIAVRSLFAKPVRVGLTIAGVALGLSLWIAIQSINKSTLKNFKDNVESITGKATLTVTAADSGFDESVVDVIKSTEGVQHVAPMTINRGFFSGSKSKTLMILGVDLLKEQSVRTYQMSDAENGEEAIDDPLVFLNQPDSIILTKQFAKANNLKLDDKIELATATGKKKFTVRGLLTPEGPAKAYGGAIAIMDIDGARFTFAKEGKLDRVDIIVKDPDHNTNIVMERLQIKLGDGYKVLKPEGQTAEIENIVKTFQVMLSFFSGLGLLVGLFMVTNSISIGVAERRKEIGTLRALGATRFIVLCSFLFEAALIGSIGSLIGCVLGKFISNYLVQDVIKSMAGQFMINLPVPKLEFGIREVLLSWFVGTSTSIIAALVPSYRATKVDPLVAISKNEQTMTLEKITLTHPITLFGFALILLSSIYTFFGTDIELNFIDNLNLFVTVMGAALVSPFLVHVLLKLALPLLSYGRTSSSTVTRLAADNLIRNPKKTMSNISILVVGLSFVILISAVNVSFNETLVSWIDRILISDFIVSSTGNVVHFDMQPLHENIGQELAKIPGIRKDHRGLVYAQRILQINYEGKLIGVRAGDEPHPEIKFRNILPVEPKDSVAIGEPIFKNDFPTLAISENFAKHFKKKRGEKMIIHTPSGPIEFLISGVYVDFVAPNGVIYINRTLFKKYWHDPLVSMFAIKLEDGATVERVRDLIEAGIGKDKNLMITTNRELITVLKESIDQSFSFLHAVEYASLFIALLGILNTLLMSILERTREIGLLRAVGMSKGQVSLMILTEAFVLGIFGSIISAGLGSWIAFSWMKNSLSKILGWVVTFYYPWGGLVTTLFAGVIVAVAAGILPSKKASDIDIREAIEYE